MPEFDEMMDMNDFSIHGLQSMSATSVASRYDQSFSNFEREPLASSSHHKLLSNESDSFWMPNLSESGQLGSGGGTTGIDNFYFDPDTINIEDIDTAYSLPVGPIPDDQDVWQSLPDLQEISTLQNPLLPLESSSNSALWTLGHDQAELYMNPCKRTLLLFEIFLIRLPLELLHILINRFSNQSTFIDDPEL